jgi:SAM-dependent methyltransferase
LREASYRCVRCDVEYPAVGGAPWLLPDPQGMLGEWRLRLARLLAELEREAQALDVELLDTTLAASTRSRLKLLAGARRDHARRLAALLAPLEPQRVAMALEMHEGVGTRLPVTQDLASYYVNVHRDWVWGDTENQIGARLVTDALAGSGPTRMLVLGAGAGRLAYDLHVRHRAALTVAADFNPLLVLLARRMAAGESVDLYEFPLAPRSIEEHALLRRLSAPTPAPSGFEIVFADATAPPFRTGAFDVVVTPWLVDVIDTAPADFLPTVNALLAPGGRWIHTGSVAFARREAARQLSLEELLECVDSAGFAAGEPAEERIPYLCSPASRHGRQETVVTFVARKIRESTRARPRRSGPAWLEDPRLPIPADRETRAHATATRIHGFVLSLVDGKRSMEDIVALLVGQRMMTRDDAVPAVRAFLRRLHAERERPRLPGR